jgi:hypothetical protein
MRKKECGMKFNFLMNSLLILLLVLAAAPPGAAEQEQENNKERIEELERRIEELDRQFRHLKAQQEQENALEEENHESLIRLSEQVSSVDESPLFNPESWVNKFTLGGYGELHANFEEDSSNDQFDIHRLVLYLGYDFNEWIKFHSETEIEHAFVSSESGGELAFEQAYLDFLLSDAVNVRTGRILTPLGIINRKHEPNSFYGVERPSFARYVIPTTWSSDGIGLFGNITPSLKYEAYVVAGLDGSQFDSINGIREGRIKERPSLNDVAVTGRLDYYPLAQHQSSMDQWLRLGVSAYAGGLDNGNKGKNPDIDADLRIYAADFEYSLSRFDFRGEIAFEDIAGAEEIGNGTAEQIFGWYVEGAYHFWPDKWKTGKLRHSDAVAFVRYDDFDTQFKMPSGVAEDPSGDRNEITLGLSFYLTPNLVVKADYQFRDSAGEDLGDAVNFGLGWAF